MKSAFFSALILAFGMLGCDEDEPPENTSKIPELGKPIVIDYDPSKENSFEDTYFEMDLDFYIPEGIEEFKNRPLLFTISTLRNRSVSGSMIEIIDTYGMIAVSPENGNSQQFELFLEALIETEYVNPENVYLAGFSAGGLAAYDLATSIQTKVKGIVLLDPATISSFEPKEETKLSVCIVCQENRVERYAEAISELSAKGIRTKIISVKDTDHFGILSSYTKQEKSDCFEFVK